MCSKTNNVYEWQGWLPPMVGEINDGKRQLHSVPIVPNKLNPVVRFKKGQHHHGVYEWMERLV